MKIPVYEVELLLGGRSVLVLTLNPDNLVDLDTGEYTPQPPVGYIEVDGGSEE